MSITAVLGANGAIPAGIKDPADDEARDGAAPLAAGVLFVAPDGEVLLLRRSSKEANYRGHWALPGGGVDAAETPQEAAARECAEEIGRKVDPAELTKIGEVPISNGGHFHTFIMPTKEKFSPLLNDEHSGYCWSGLDSLPRPLHPKVEELLTGAEQGQDRALAMDWLRRGLDVESTDRKVRLALDKESARDFDRDGRMHVKANNICRVAINPYRGNEIPGWRELGLEPERIYQLFRDPEEIKKAVDTANGIQILRRHTPVNAEDAKLYDVVGATGSDAEFDGEFLRNSLHFWTQQAIDDIESDEKRELSPGYHYKPDMTPGNFNGKGFDGVMRDIHFNHVAIVEDGRQGPEVVVGDSALTESAETKERHEGKLSERTRGEIGTVGSKKRQELSEGDFLEPASKKYPVKKDGKYDRNLLLAAAREARMHGRDDLAKRADAIRAREFGSEQAKDSKESMMKKPTRLAAIALGLTSRGIRPLLAMDAKVDLMPIFAGVTSKNFDAKKLAGSVAAAIKGKTIAQDVNIEHVAKMLDHVGEKGKEDAGSDESVSEPQHKAMMAAAEGHSNLGIPKKVGEEFKEKDKGKGFDSGRARDFMLKNGLSEDDADNVAEMLEKFFAQEAEEPEHEGEDEETEEEKKDNESEGERIHEREKDEKKGEDHRGARDKGARDKAKDEEMVTKPAMDAAIKASTAAAVKAERQNQQNIRDALRNVRPWVGELNEDGLAFDSAGDVYRHVAEMLKVEDAKKLHVDALWPIIKNQPKPGERQSRGGFAHDASAGLALDSTSFDEAKKYAPGLDRVSVGI